MQINSSAPWCWTQWDITVKAKTHIVYIKEAGITNCRKKIRNRKERRQTLSAAVNFSGSGGGRKKMKKKKIEKDEEEEEDEEKEETRRWRRSQKKEEEETHIVRKFLTNSDEQMQSTFGIWSPVGKKKPNTIWSLNRNTRPDCTRTWQNLH